MKAETNLRLEITRVIKAPRERIYAAWTNSAELRKWFGPEKVETRDLIAETYAGGKFQWDLTNSDGEQMTMLGEFRELQPGKRIVFTWQWQNDEDWQDQISIVTVELSDHESGTKLRLIHERLPTKSSRDGHNDGWNSALNKLENYLGV